MGRRKLEIKRIEDKNSRQVAFSKRRGGLFNKARHLSALCDADIAAVVFSSRGKLYQFSSGCNSVEHILSRYEKNLETEARSISGIGEAMALHSRCTRFRTCDELLNLVKRFVEEPNVQEYSVAELTQLEEEITIALMQTRSRKTQSMMEYVSTLRDKETKLSGEKQEMTELVSSAKQNGREDDGGGGVNDLATNRTNLPILPLFTR